MQMIIDFPGGSKVDAHFGRFAVQTDQPPAASAPTPFDLFLSSVGTCAGIYVLNFCRQRGLQTEGLQIVQKISEDPTTRMVHPIKLDMHLSQDFPEKHREAVMRFAELFAVKKHMEPPPVFRSTTSLS